MRTPVQLSWHVPAIVFFAAGSVIGCVFLGMGALPAIRFLGVVALVSGIVGASLMILTMQMENPAEWIMLRRQAHVLLQTVRRKLGEWWRRGMAAMTRGSGPAGAIDATTPRNRGETWPPRSRLLG